MSYDCPICLVPINEDGPKAAVEAAAGLHGSSGNDNGAQAGGRGRKRPRDAGTDIFSTSPTGGQCTTSCGHLFHIGCLEQLFNAQTTANCPTCTKKIWRSKLVRVYLSQNPVGTREKVSTTIRRTGASTQTTETMTIPDIPSLFQNNISSYMEDMKAVLKNLRLLSEMSKVNVLLLENLKHNLTALPDRGEDELANAEESAEREPALKKQRSLKTAFGESSSANRLLKAQYCSALTLGKVPLDGDSD